jgi:hypothetical protein
MSRLRTPSGRRVALNLPAGSGLEEIETARAELERLNKERRETQERHRELVAARESAKQSDLELAARAIRGNKAAPKTRAVDAVDADLAKLEEHLAAVDTALDQVEAELIDQVARMRDQRLGELDEQFAKELADWREGILERVDQLERINQVGSLRAWYRDFPGKFPQFRSRSFGHLEMRNGTDTPAAALKALHAAFDPPDDRHVMPIPGGEPSPLRSRNAANAA